MPAPKMPYLGPIAATVGRNAATMISMTQTPAAKRSIPPGDLPATPDDIDLERIVSDPDYRRAVQELLRRWGIRDRKSDSRRGQRHT